MNCRTVLCLLSILWIPRLALSADVQGVYTVPSDQQTPWHKFSVEYKIEHNQGRIVSIRYSLPSVLVPDHQSDIVLDHPEYLEDGRLVLSSESGFATCHQLESTIDCHVIYPGLHFNIGEHLDGLRRTMAPEAFSQYREVVLEFGNDPEGRIEVRM
ncbi:MAG: hypothetical protein HRU19_00920 [Pseudobacteriovorax sp.]|nr:hypothetical protein [Pseudobacteriovorax sp.]